MSSAGATTRPASFWNVFGVWFTTTEHQDTMTVEAFRQMCEPVIAVYDGTEDQRVADWARDALRLLDERDP